jgi:hypothetical protein
MTPGPRTHRWLPHLAALATYALLAVLATWPVAANLGYGIVGEVGAVDAYQDAWHLWWNAEALSQGRLPFFTPLLYYPRGVDMFWLTLGFAQGAPLTPVTRAFGPLAAYGLATLLSYVVAGYAAFLLARRVTGSAPAALVGGAVFALSPYHLDKVVEGNLPLLSVQWVPCYALALLLLLERPSWRRALLSGALLIWLSLGSWYYGLFALMYTGCAALIWSVSREGGERAERTGDREQGERLTPRAGSLALHLPTLLWGLAPVALWGLAVAPRIGGLTGGEQSLMDMRSVIAERSADLLDFFLPNPRHPWWGASVAAWRERLYPDAIIWNVSLGWVGLALALLGLVAARDETPTTDDRRPTTHDRRGMRGERPGTTGGRLSTVWRWWLLLGAALVLAMGPSLRVAGLDTGLPLPFALLQNLPGIRAGQRPNHMAVFAILALAVLAAHGLSRLLARLGDRGPARGPRGAWALAGLVVALTLWIDGYAGPLGIVRREVHPFYATLPAPDGALMALPMLLNINRSDTLTPQMTHGWPIMGGYVARPPRYDFPRYTPGVRELEQGRAEQGDIVAPGWPEIGRRALAAYRVRYVTLDLTAERDPGRFGLGKAEYFARVRALLGELGAGPPLVADADLEAYELPRSWEAAPLAFLGKGWQPLERQEGTDYRWRWMGERAEIRLYNPHAAPVPATLTLRAAAFERERPLRLALGEVSLGELRVAPGEPASRAVRFLLPPGEHSLWLVAEAATDGGRAEPISVRVFDVALEVAD